MCLRISHTLTEPRRRRQNDHAPPRTVAACTLFAGVALLALRLPGSEPAARMLICSFAARTAAMRLTVLLVGLLTCTPSTLNAPTRYTRSSPCVLETPQYDTYHDSNSVHARFLPNWLPTTSKILPKSSCLASRGTFPWSAFVDSDILGMLNAPLPPQPLELDFQTLELYF